MRRAPCASPSPRTGPTWSKEAFLSTRRQSCPWQGHREYRTGRTFSDQETYALCRCGRTSTPPFCDGSHLEGFDGTETAGHEPYRDRADVYPGDGVYLFDDNRCAYARFCHREDGDVWSLTEASYDPHYKREAVRACPTALPDGSPMWTRQTSAGVRAEPGARHHASGGHGGRRERSPVRAWAHHVGSRRRHRIRTAQPRTRSAAAARRATNPSATPCT